VLNIIYTIKKINIERDQTPISVFFNYSNYLMLKIFINNFLISVLPNVVIVKVIKKSLFLALFLHIGAFCLSIGYF